MRKIVPEVYDTDGDWTEEDLAGMDVTPEQMNSWDTVEQELQQEEQFYTTCPCCTDRELEQSPHIKTDSNTLRAKTYPIRLQDGENASDVFDREEHVINFDETELYEHAQLDTREGYFRRNIYCKKHEDTVFLDYVGKGKARLDRYGLKAALIVE